MVVRQARRRARRRACCGQSADDHGPGVPRARRAAARWRAPRPGPAVRSQPRPGAGPMSIAITLVAALLLGFGFVLQQHAAAQAPTAHFLRLALIGDLLRNRRWLAGIAVMVAGQLLSAWS